jgi:hypothetical protein
MKWRTRHCQGSQHWSCRSTDVLAALRSTTRPLLCLALLGIAQFALGQQGTITGTVLDTSGASVAQADVKLSLDGRGPDQEMPSKDGGGFAFSNVAPGPFRLSFTGNGFAARTIAGEIHADETLGLPPITLAVGTLATTVNVTQTQSEIAEAQIKAEVQQRLIGVIPNYFVTYETDAAPLNTAQKFELARKDFLDPFSFVINGIVAGVGQAQNANKGFGQGAQGYAKRYGAGYADYTAGSLIGSVIMPAIFKQDPRYFYKGTGSKRSRFFYAISRTVICRGDNKHDQFCYSSFISRPASGFLSNYYYPAADRNSAGVIFENAAVGIGAEAIGNLFQEFVARRFIRNKR